MKKIYQILFLLLTLFITQGVKAETFYEDNWISGIYATYQKDGYTKSQLMRFIRRKGDNKPAYCLTPSAFLYEDEVYTAYITNQAESLNISKDKFKRISEIAYFGYNYKTHTDNKWYAITQMMLWKEMDPKADIFYTDKFKGNRITRFVNETKEIEDLIVNYNKVPSINNLDLTINKEYEIEDINHVLNDFKIEASSDLNVEISNNKLKIKPIKKGKYEIKFIKKVNNYSNNPTAYRAKNGQDVLMTGNLEPIQKQINVNITGGNLEITKVDSETLTIKPQGSGTLVGAKYNLYNQNHKLVDTLTIKQNSKASINDLEYGDYYLKEIEAPIGYQLDSKTYNIKIDQNENKLTLKEAVIKGKLIINKYASNDNVLIKETNVKFSIYDSNNKLIDTISTDENGQIELELLYGKYLIKQETTWLGYKKIDDFFVTIDSTDDTIINLTNEKIKANLKIIKKDKENNVVLSNASFKIKDINTNKYIYILNNGKKEDIFKTNEDGIINIPIDGGSYILEEIESPTGYIKGGNLYFVIDEDTKLIDNTLEIIAYNKLVQGKIKIYKQGLINNNLINLENVKFGLYAKEDIKIGNSIYYKKDELVEILVTDKDGISISKLLPFGKYYIKEISTNEKFILDLNEYLVNIDSENIKEINLINKEKVIDKIEYPKISNDDKNIDNKLKIEYPKTSNRDKYINVIITYLIFMFFIILVSKLKDEK